MSIVPVAFVVASVLSAPAEPATRLDTRGTARSLSAADDDSAEGDVARPSADDRPETSFWDKFRDEEDGAFDIGDWLSSGRAVLPFALPISEPAVGVGLAVAVAYFHPSKHQAPDGDASVPPSISFMGGAGTDNGTRGAAAGHLGVWNGGRTRYVGAVLGADVNLTFFDEGAVLDDGLTWNLRTAGTYHQLKLEVAERFFVGAQYYFLATESRIGDADLPPVEASELESHLAGLGVIATYDSRNTVFTPTKGLFANLAVIVHDEVFGSDFSYPRLNLAAYKYWELDRFVVGLRLEGSATGSEAPFYGLPYLRMRGVPAFRYIGRHTALAEVEPIWRVTRRWSWLGFLAAGQGVAEASDLGDGDTIVAGGTGFRYLLARKQGLAMGLDVAWGPEETAVYFVVGSYWGGR